MSTGKYMDVYKQCFFQAFYTYESLNMRSGNSTVKRHHNSVSLKMPSWFLTWRFTGAQQFFKMPFIKCHTYYSCHQCYKANLCVKVSENFSSIQYVICFFLSIQTKKLMLSTDKQYINLFNWFTYLNDYDSVFMIQKARVYFLNCFFEKGNFLNRFTIPFILKVVSLI